MSLRWFLCSLVYAFSLASVADGQARQPNVVLIVADDLGWADTNLYAPHELHLTPSIDALASRGTRFTNAYGAGPVCAPSRNALLTGMWPARTGMYDGNCEKDEVVLVPRLQDQAAPNHRLLLPIPVSRLRPVYCTLAEALRGCGYATGHFGKWHQGYEPFTPSRNGYDVEEPKMYGARPLHGTLFDEEGNHIDDVCAVAAVRFMRKNRDRPFFVSYCPFSVHSPFEAKPELVETFRERAVRVGSDASPTYAAMVRTLDLNVGRLMTEIDELRLKHDTIVIFASDNGGDVHRIVDGVPATSNAPWRSGKGTLYEGGIRVPMIVSWPGVVPQGEAIAVLAQTIDIYPTILDLVGAEPLPGQILDGISLGPALAGESTDREALFWYHPHESARVVDQTLPGAVVRFGDLKLIREFFASPHARDVRRLYDLAEDPSETTDLAEALPEVVDTMDAMLDDWLQETGAILPEPNPDYVPDDSLELEL